jgi:hypothetical protein
MRVHSQGWLKDVSRIQATSEIERGQDHEQEEPIAPSFIRSSTSPAQSSPVLRPTRSNGPGEHPLLFIISAIRDRWARENR